MKLHFDSKLCQYPRTFFSFILNFLLWKYNFATKMCTNCPFYKHSVIFAALYLLVELALSSYDLIQLMLTPPDSPECSAHEWVLPLRLGSYHVSLRIGGYYFQLAGALFSVQAAARSLYYLVTGGYQALLGSVMLVPLFIAMSAIGFSSAYRRLCPGERCRSLLLKQGFRFGTALVYWSSVCCLLYNEYSNCIFEQ
ncbi:uncharacterized protein LOC129730042 [Wyeomyia smithii]|uniref:uncharacterized protein LOC129730042 n=1 Tax=Wyeomyia smithii TaxID=174621 RepID=UPI002467D36D|nr:uncharacterized protein LOC129730042 [Wyeomyia smithii]